MFTMIVLLWIFGIVMVDFQNVTLLFVGFDCNVTCS